MNRIASILVWSAVLVFAHGQEAAAPLSLFVVETSFFDGSHFVDTVEYPKLGFVAKEPALRIAAFKQVSAIASPWKQHDRSGNVLDTGMLYQVSIVLSDADGKSFAALTQANNGKRVAMLLGDRIVAAPFIRGPISGGSIAITVQTEQDMRNIEKQLKPFVKP